MADFQHWFGLGHADGFSREVAQASVAVAAAKDALYEALQRGYPEGAEVYVVHHRGCFHGTVEGWDTHGCRVLVKNTVTGKTSKWWAAHVELVNAPSGVEGHQNSSPENPDNCDPKRSRDYAALQQGIRSEPDRRIPGDGDGAFAGSPLGVAAVEAPRYAVRWSNSGYVVYTPEGSTLTPEEVERALGVPGTFNEQEKRDA